MLDHRVQIGVQLAHQVLEALEDTDSVQYGTASYSGTPDGNAGTREAGHRLPARHAQRPDLAGLDVGRRGRNVLEHELDVATHEVDSAGPLPLYATCVRFTFATSLKSSAAMCVAEPAPAEP